MISDRTVTHAVVMNTVRDFASTVDTDRSCSGIRLLTPEGLYRRRKMTALFQRSLTDASPGSVDRALGTLGLSGIRRSKGVRTKIPGIYNEEVACPSARNSPKIRKSRNTP